MFAMSYIFIVGMVIGLFLDVAIILLHRFHMTKKFYILNYIGCQITGKSSGNLSFIVGLVYSMVASGLLALIYSFVIEHFQLPLTMHTVILLASIKTVISGFLLPIFDRFNRCVQNGSIAAMGLFGSGNGVKIAILFVLGNIVYVLVIVKVLAR